MSEINVYPWFQLILISSDRARTYIVRVASPSDSFGKANTEDEVEYACEVKKPYISCNK